MKRSHRRTVLGLVYALSLGGLLALAWRGHSYYLTPLIDRPRHEDYWVLKPGGSLGHLYGVLGASLGADPTDLPRPVHEAGDELTHRIGRQLVRIRRAVGVVERDPS